jgi:hypothetical protein
VRTCVCGALFTLFWYTHASSGCVVDGLCDATEALRLTAGVWQKSSGGQTSTDAVGPWRTLAQHVACLLVTGELYAASGALEDAAHAFAEGAGLVCSILTCCTLHDAKCVQPKYLTGPATGSRQWGHVCWAFLVG